MSDRLDPDLELALAAFSLGMALGYRSRRRKNREIKRQAERTAEMNRLIGELHAWTMESTKNCSVREEGWFDEYLTRAKFINIVNETI